MSDYHAPTTTDHELLIVEELENLIELAHTEIDQFGQLCVDTHAALLTWGIDPEEFQP